MWSLGIILINMLSGRNPWGRTSLSDQGFAAFVHDPDYLYDCLSLSRGAARLISRTLSIDPRHRISIGELRQGVLAEYSERATRLALSQIPICRFNERPAHTAVFRSGQGVVGTVYTGW